MATEAKTIQALLDKVLADGELCGEDKQRIDSMLLGDGQVGVQEREQLDRLLRLIAEGKVRVVP